MKIIKINKFRLRFKSFIYSKLYAMIARNGGQAIVGLIVRLITAMGDKPSKSIVWNIKLILHSISRIAANQGKVGLVKYLKTISICLQQCIAGHKPNPRDHSPRVSLTSSGIPKVLPPIFRKFIRNGNFLIIRISLTVMSLYRDINYLGKLKTETITDPYGGTQTGIRRIVRFIPLFVKLFVTPVFNLPLNCKTRRDALQGKFSYFPIAKSAPLADKAFSISSNPIVMIKTALAFTDDQVRWLQILFRLVSNNQFRIKDQKDGSWPYFPASDLFDYVSWIRGAGAIIRPFSVLENKNSSYTGKLGTKVEAAGKVRVYAMVDPWTQMVMKPFHDYLFSILRKHSRVDGTFDQLKPLKRAWGFNHLYSMDLSSATDRLPLAIQTILFREVFELSKEESEAWANLLVKRDYRLPKMSGSEGFVRYAVGQPMGALSSWAMLALTHHLIVNCAAWESGHPRDRLFKNYAILGDDIVIFDKRVARCYHRILTSIDVKCSLAKSILSPKGLGLEFAKRTLLRGTDVSPTPLKEFHSALEDPVSLLSYGRKYGLSIPQMLKVGGLGYKVLGSLDKPLSKLNFKVKMVIISSSLTSNSLRKLLESKFSGLSEELKTAISVTFMRDLFTSLRLKLASYQRQLSKISYWDCSSAVFEMRGPVASFAQFLYEKVYFSHRDRLSRELDSVKINTPFFSTIEREIPDPISEIDNFLLLDRTVAKVSLDTFTMKIDKTESKRSNFISRPKFDKFSESWARLISTVAKRMREDKPLKSDYMESSLFLIKRLPLRRILTTLRVIPFIKRRLIWLGSFTTLLSVMVFLKGLQPVLEVVVAISVLLSSLWGIDESIPGSKLLPWIGNFVVHALELWLAAGIIVLFCKWSIIHPFLRAELLAYDQGHLQLWECLYDALRIINRLIYDTATGAITSIPDVLASQGFATNFIIGALGIQLLGWLLKWLFGL